MKNISILVLAVIILSVPLTMVQADDETEIPSTVFYGSVIDNSTLEPISGAFVYAFDDTFKAMESVTTDEDGNYKMEFYVWGTFYIYAEFESYEQESSTVSVESNEDREVNFRMDKIEVEEGDSLLYGVVKDSKTGEPISDVYVTISLFYDENGKFYRSYQVADIYTDENGYYSAYVQSGNYSIKAWKEGYNSPKHEVFPISEGVEYEHNIELVKWTDGVMGQVSDEDGDPLSGVVVTLENDRFTDTAVTDDDGEYQIMVPYPTSYTLSCHEEGYRPYIEPLNIDGGIEKADIELVETIIPSPILQLIYMILSLITG